MDIYFVSSNEFKINEAISIMAPFGVHVIAHELKIKELQTMDTEELVRDKAKRAFKEIGRPLFVEHTGLYLELLSQLPGGLTQTIWDSLGKDRFSSLFASETSVATAKTTIGFIDGKRFHLFHGETIGKIVSPPRYDNKFQWDCIFVPDGEALAFSEMGDRKNMISMRRKALESLRMHLVE
jgi:XTP/dITP diphosphohydrolase